MRHPVAFPFVLSLMLSGAAACSSAHATPGASGAAVGPIPTVTTTMTAHSGFAPVVARIAPAVVAIEVTERRDAVTPTSGFHMQQFGGQGGNPFGDQQDDDDVAPARGAGSGVIMSADGYVVTNNHVVEKASKMSVRLADGRVFTARLVGRDPDADIAVIKIAASNLPLATFADSDEVKVGDYALAVGNPFGIGETVTMGIISATGRGGMGITDYEDFLQTDAAINPGNSGGALVNEHGDLVGINTAILSKVGGNHGVGFAVPSSMVKDIAAQLIGTGKVARGFLAVSIQDVTPELADALQIPERRGALIGDVVAGGPAAKAGLRRGDVVLELDGKPMTDARRLRLAIAHLAPNTSVTLQVRRGGKVATMAVKLGLRPDERKVKVVTPVSGEQLGISLGELTPDVRDALGADATLRGALIDNVRADGQGAEVGLARGDVIIEIDAHPIIGAAAAAKALGDGQQHALLVWRRGQTVYVGVGAQ